MWKKLLWLAALVWIGVLIDVSLIYLSRRYPGLGFKFTLKPEMDLF